MHKPMRVLSVCDGGSARSRMAEDLLRATGGSDVEVHSAGIEAEVLNWLPSEVMGEMDIDNGNEAISALNDFEHRQFDFGIVLCEEAK